MNRSTWCLAVLSVLTLADYAGAGDSWFRCLQRERQCTGCAATPCCCPDDYCRKPLPCLPCVPLQGCCNDYCPKPPPCVGGLCLPCCGDDYCRKPLPQFCCPDVGYFPFTIQKRSTHTAFTLSGFLGGAAQR